MSGSNRLLYGKAKTSGKSPDNNIIALSKGRYAVIGDTLIGLDAGTAVELAYKGQILDANDSPSLALIKEGKHLRLRDEL